MASPAADLYEHKVHTVVVGASAGGIEALRHFIAVLPVDFPATVLVVVHLSPVGTSVLPQILERAGDLPACHPVDGEPLEPGHIYIAPPDRHLLVEAGYARLGRGPKRNGHRPAIDRLFETASAAYDGGVAGVVLSGALDDGTAGLIAIRRRGGLAFVQEPSEALYAMMPQSAIEFAAPDLVATAEELGRVVAGIAEAPPARPPHPSPSGPDQGHGLERATGDSPQEGESSGLTCPECNGGIWEDIDQGVARYRCRVGHEYSAESFLLAQADRVEAALWTALRAVEERAAVHRRIAERQRRRGLEHIADRYEARAEEAVEHALVLRQLADGFARTTEDVA